MPFCRIFSADFALLLTLLLQCILCQHTHEPNVHQLIVKVDGWKQVQPVSVDKVGVYFRHASADIDTTSKMVLLCLFCLFVIDSFYISTSDHNVYIMPCSGYCHGHTSSRCPGLWLSGHNACWIGCCCTCSLRY